jgi:hypothetical protein
MFMRTLFHTHDVIAISIVDTLVALRWGDEIDKIPASYALTNHKFIKIPQLLTEQSEFHPVSVTVLFLTLHTTQSGQTSAER